MPPFAPEQSPRPAPGGGGGATTQAIPEGGGGNPGPSPGYPGPVKGLVVAWFF